MMNLIIFNLALKTILTIRDETIPQLFAFLDIFRKLFEILKNVLYKSFIIKTPLFNYFNEILKK